MGSTICWNCVRAGAGEEVVSETAPQDSCISLRQQTPPVAFSYRRDVNRMVWEGSSGRVQRRWTEGSTDIHA